VNEATIRAAFPEANSRRAMLTAFGAGTLLAAIEGLLPLQNAREAMAQATAAREKRALKIGFIHILARELWAGHPRLRLQGGIASLRAGPG